MILRSGLMLGMALALVSTTSPCSPPCECDDDDDTAGDDDTSTGDDDTVDPTVDLDGDGYTPEQGDCDESDPDVNPDGDDVCGDDIDSDCDGVSDYGCRVHVPEGEFQMGMPDEYGNLDQRPIHAVYLHEYWIDRYEVTVEQFKLCVADGTCEAPRYEYSFTRDHYYDDEEFARYPVVFVRRELARIYCGWVGGYLPTEAQWEKAARGADDERLFPWGDWYDCSHGNANWCIGDTLQVGSYEVNRSPYGAMDMSGNVWEFVNDHYAPDYYSTSPYENPTGPVDDTGALTLRGGGFTWWGNPSVSVRHPGISQDAVQFNIGFRCAYDEDAR